MDSDGFRWIQIQLLGCFAGIIFQGFGKIILKHDLENKSRLFFKILAKIFLNKIIDFTS